MSQPLVLPTVTVEQDCVQFVVIVGAVFTATTWVTVGFPVHDRVMVEATVPPFAASNWISVRGVMNVNGALSGVPSGYETLCVVNRLYGPERYHVVVSQSMPQYVSVSGRFGFARSSKVQVVGVDAVTVTVTVVEWVAEPDAMDTTEATDPNEPALHLAHA